MKQKKLHTISVCLLLLLQATMLQADETVLLDKKVSISQSKGTIYELLQLLSEQTGYLFIYDSNIINNDQTVRVRKGEYTILSAVHAITNNPKLRARSINNHILLYLSEEKTYTNDTTLLDERQGLVVKGKIYDQITKEPIPSALISLTTTNTAITANQNGEFKLLVADSLTNATVKFSHLGYESKDFDISALGGLSVEVYLTPRTISLQEVVVRRVNPTLVLQKMLQNRTQNYSANPAVVTAFYREVTKYKNQEANATEGVLDIYKTGYQQQASGDQVKLIKMRRVLKEHSKDSIIVKIKAGIEACLRLDIIKELPDFLSFDDKEFGNQYTYLHTDITNIDNEDVYVISFQQKDNIEEPLYQGQLFIATSTYALVGAYFEVNPHYVEKATDSYLIKTPKTHRFTLQHASYSLSYKRAANGTYYLSYAYGDIQFKVKKRRTIFSFPLNLFFEMVATDVQNQNAKRFPRDERLQTGKVFSDTKHSFDANFWNNFNIITPEDNLKMFLMKNQSVVSETPNEE